ncbi:Sas10/Utp3/C1D family-domain-containing protein [Paraphysoderma sedebokerense]|nr:Sas10/Utp3/C1D family-domain-containing protein [Paraphysoderma sedebokerense]
MNSQTEVTDDLSLQLSQTLDTLSTSLENVKRHLEPLLSSPLNETLSKLDNLDKAKCEVMLAYTIGSLFYVYLKTQGIPTKDHQIMKEMGRIQSYFKKIKTVEGSDKAKMRLEKEAAGRFIKHALAGNESQSEFKNFSSNQFLLCPN